MLHTGALLSLLRQRQERTGLQVRAPGNFLCRRAPARGRAGGVRAEQAPHARELAVSPTGTPGSTCGNGKWFDIPRRLPEKGAEGTGPANSGRIFLGPGDVIRR